MLVLDVLLLELVSHHVSMDSENSGVLADVAEELQDHRCESEERPQEQWSPWYLKQVDQRAPNCQHSMVKEFECCCKSANISQSANSPRSIILTKGSTGELGLRSPLSLLQCPTA